MKLVVFDLDGTLIRGRTVLEHLARKLGQRALVDRAERCRTRRQIERARAALDTAYGSRRDGDLARLLPGLPFAPGVEPGFARLREQGVRIAIATLTWSFAATWCARRLGVQHCLATRRGPHGRIRHVWPSEKAIWLRRLALAHGIALHDVAAVGDSPSDLPMLRAAGQGWYVGRIPPHDLGALRHRPLADIGELVEEMLA